MNETPDRAATGRRAGRGIGGKSKLAGLAVMLLVGLYSFSAPQLNARFGWNLPQIHTNSDGQIRVAPSPSSSPKASGSDSSVSDRLTGIRQKDADETQPAESDQESSSRDGASSSKEPTSGQQSRRSPGPLAKQVQSSRSGTDGSARAPPETVAADSSREADDDLLYGLLREISSDRYLSPAGLLYTPGSAEGHRLEHLRRHTKNDPGRPGSHGVFDGGMAGALETIDLAYGRAKKGQRTTKKVDQGRTIYTVDMGKRIGYVGGRDGGRRRNPMARRIRIVVEDNRVITAYPM